MLYIQMKELKENSDDTNFIPNDCCESPDIITVDLDF